MFSFISREELRHALRRKSELDQKKLKRSQEKENQERGPPLDVVLPDPVVGLQHGEHCSWIGASIRREPRGLQSRHVRTF